MIVVIHPSNTLSNFVGVDFFAFDLFDESEIAITVPIVARSPLAQQQNLLQPKDLFPLVVAVAVRADPGRAQQADLVLVAQRACLTPDIRPTC